MQYLLAPHSRRAFHASYHRYLQRIAEDNADLQSLPLSVMELVAKLQIPRVNLIHFGGMEDKKHYNLPEISTEELEKWVTIRSKNFNLQHISFRVPQTGEVFQVS